MIESPDPLEAELSALEPQRISDELRRRIASRLAEAVAVQRRTFWKPVLAGSLAAACLAMVAWWWLGGGQVASPPAFARSLPTAVAPVDVSKPTLLAYQRALSRSPEELETLLNSQACATPFRNPHLVQIGAFTRSDAALHALLGDD
jgi:hypothetical protein